jgi:putative methionine-R-sulfoxide reductase with GAF domain
MPDRLEDRGWRNWILALSVLLATTIGLGAVVLTLLNARDVVPWPWPRSEAFLTVTLILTSLLFVAYLTHAQRRLMLHRRESRRLQDQHLRQARLHSDRVSAFLKLARTLGTEISPQVIFDRITEICLATFVCDQASLMLLDRERQTLEVRSAAGHPSHLKIVGRRQKVGHGIAGRVAETGEGLLLGPEMDTGEFVGLEPRNYFTSSAMVVPIVLRDERIGVLSVSSRSPDIRYAREDFHALEVFAETAAVYCRFAEQSEWMRQTIRTLEHAIQEKS